MACLLAHIGNAWFISNKAGIATAYEVIPSTIGQYTGLTDKNGKRIFEGEDIICHYNNGLKNTSLYDSYGKDVGRVFWYQTQTRFLRTSKNFPDDCPDMCDNCEYEVIGNIHDNPEILEEAKP